MSTGMKRLIPIYGVMLIWVTSWSISVNSPVMPLYINSLGISEQGWGLLAMAMAIGMVLFEWLWGALSDRGNRLVYGTVALAGMAVIFPLYTFQWLIPYFAVLQFMFGVFSITLGPISRSIVADYSTPGSLGMTMSLWSVFMTVGTMVGSLLGTFIAEVWGFQYAFYASSILALLGAVASLLSTRLYRVEKDGPIPGLSEAVRGGFSGLMSDPSIRMLMIVSVVAFMARSVIWTFLPLYASVHVGMSTMEIGILTASTSLVTLVASVVVGKLSERMGSVGLSRWGLLLASFFIFAYYFADTPFQMFLFSALVSVCLSVAPLITAVISEFTPREHMGMSMGILGSFEDIGMVAGPALYGFVWAAYSPRYIFIVSGVAQLVGALLLFTIKQKK